MTTNNKKEILWTAKEAVEATGGEATHDFAATGISIDTRTLKKGQAFLALKGEKLDGHDYVEAAFKAGASAAIVSKDFKPEDATWPLLRVDDTMKALEGLGRASRARTKATIIGVTGSAGKTGTKEMLSVMLGAIGETHASKKSFNNHWGVPLSLANLPKTARFAVFEMGMNHKGEMSALTAQVRPQIVIITTIEPAHIEHFKTVEAIADAKAEIFEGMDDKGIVILNVDNPHFARLKNAAEKRGLRKIYGFGEDEEAKSRLIDCTLHADSSRVTADILGERVKYKINIPGKHIVVNSLGALTVVKAAAGELGKAVEALKNSEPVEGRGNRIMVTLDGGKPPLTIIDESYNANPASMLAALKVFELVQPAPEGRRIAVLGDMLELGKDGPRLHAELANPLLKAKTELLFCCGPQMDALYHALPPDWRGAHESDSKALAARVIEAVRPGDVLLIKGSAGSKMGYIIHALQALQPSQQKQKDQRNAV
ncbi:MAG: UDP-N-acetylmuramoylalanyl-D-glutamyl-2,6-diaminopimelate--D-alanyl-D-alanine ligase [Alphaproteobacteria bacterium]|nr:MAG: UDP-N-acetylmuramoylalanyl-D-glutamyl-2,6-diaminopimelate--D-alanyl-D-alanine ligase [Alphaproteobacteria bacterium]